LCWEKRPAALKTRILNSIRDIRSLKRKRYLSDPLNLSTALVFIWLKSLIARLWMLMIEKMSEILNLVNMAKGFH
jgi:hypothetical protein